MSEFVAIYYYVWKQHYVFHLALSLSKDLDLDNYNKQQEDS